MDTRRTVVRGGTRRLGPARSPRFAALAWALVALLAFVACGSSVHVVGPVPPPPGTLEPDPSGLTETPPLPTQTEGAATPTGEAPTPTASGATPTQGRTARPATPTPGTPRPATPPPATPTPTPTSATPTPTAPDTIVVTNYHLLDSGNGPRLVPVPRTLERVPAIGGATLRALLGGPSGRESKAGIVSMIPTGAILLGLSIQDGVATVDLSSEFAGGGSETDVQARVAQVLYSLTQFSTVKRVAFELDGQPTAVPTGNGETVERPVARDDYLELLPPVFVETPRWGETVTHPLRISGVANVFEARFFVELRDANDSLARQAVMATCGSGCWGTFEATIPYASAIAQPGTLMTYTVSQGGPGGPTDDERSYGVELTAGG